MFTSHEDNPMKTYSQEHSHTGRKYQRNLTSKEDIITRQEDIITSKEDNLTGKQITTKTTSQKYNLTTN